MERASTRYHASYSSAVMGRISIPISFSAEPQHAKALIRRRISAVIRHLG